MLRQGRRVVVAAVGRLVLVEDLLGVPNYDFVLEQCPRRPVPRVQYAIIRQSRVERQDSLGHGGSMMPPPPDGYAGLMSMSERDVRSARVTRPWTSGVTSQARRRASHQ